MNSGAGWARMQGLQYRRLCARPGCGAQAVTTLRFQPTLRQAWLVDLDETSARTQGDLCQRHAEALVLPRGWELHDDRTGRVSRRVEEPRAEPAAATPRRVRKRGRAGGESAAPNAPSQLPGFEPAAAPEAGAGEANGSAADETAPDLAAEAEAEPEPEIEESVRDAPATRTVPAQFGSNDDDEVDVDDEALSAILDARTPLLQRAFRNAKPSE